ncbi:general transcription factor 3C polypeptide 5 isoform X2 [Bacillus rossius redtenbacheri]|uniref:general transcription factor 3C polypeptide 5 isoform X2 n=1 Tax=Bacillus rossius redtenbacheri TaxID=93214 RepID=UPI002FDEFFBA
MSENEHNFDRQFVCVEYPGVVHNDDLMLKTLGGITNISRTYSKKNRRLELRFRPDDAYCKPTCGLLHHVSAVLLKVKVRKKQSQDPSSSEVPQYDCTAIVVGQVSNVYRFTNLCDFQYLPMRRDETSDGRNVCIYKELVPHGLPTSDWLYADAPQFLTPAAFSRMDNMQSYLYRKEAADDFDTTPQNIIGCTRRKRSGHAMFVTFDVDEVPSGPREIALQLLSLKFLNEKFLDKIKEIFDQRPVWSKNALMHLTRFNKDQIKYLLPAVAYYFVTGPWRVMWVRFGYDPRADVSARIYQTLDYRLRVRGGLKTKVKAKRNYCDYVLPYKAAPVSQTKQVMIGGSKDSSSQKVDEEHHFSDRNYIFRAGMVPPSRQMFYQVQFTHHSGYCDVDVPEIQAMLRKLPEPPPGAECHEKLGWMPPGFDEQCREIVNNLVTEALQEAEDNEGGVAAPHQAMDCSE